MLKYVKIFLDIFFFLFIIGGTAVLNLNGFKSCIFGPKHPTYPLRYAIIKALDDNLHFVILYDPSDDNDEKAPHIVFCIIYSCLIIDKKQLRLQLDDMTSIMTI